MDERRTFFQVVVTVRLEELERWGVCHGTEKSEIKHLRISKTEIDFTRRSRVKVRAISLRIECDVLSGTSRPC